MFNKTKESQARSEAKGKLVQHFLKMKEGEFIDYGTIAARFSLRVTVAVEGQAIRAAVKQAQKRHSLLIHTKRGMGFKITQPQEINGLVDVKVQRTRRALKRTAEYVEVALQPNYYNRLDKDDKKELYRKAAILGALDLAKAVTPSTQRKALSEGRTIQLPEVPA